MVEIVPRSTEKESQEVGILFYISILFLVLSIISYFVFFSLQKRAETTRQNLLDQIQKETPAEIISLKEKVENYEKKIKDFTPLLKKHILASNFLKFLEEKTHPQVFFTEINLDLEKSMVDLSGQTDNFFILGQQLLILEQEPLISELKLDQLAIGKEGKIDFVLNFSFSPKITQQ